MDSRRLVTLLLMAFQAVCERIMATDLTERFVGTQRYSMEQKNEALESRNLFYLFGCYCRLQNESEVFKV